MSQNPKTHCFLCRKSGSAIKGCKSIDDDVCTASKKKIKDILNYLGRCSKSILPTLPRGQSICLSCTEQLEDFDAALVCAMNKQRKMAELVEKACLNVDVDVVEECIAIEREDFEDITITEAEIAETVRDMECDDGSLSGTVLYVPSIPCNFCAMEFKNKTRLNKHVAYAHKKFSCNQCSYSHRNEDYVKLHMNIHEGRGENQCRFCEKEYSTKMSLIRHMECHIESKKYQCDKCGLCFSQSTVLYNHKLQHEAEEQPLQCEICSQVFKTKRTFRHHMITHQADRPRYSCEYCSKTFTEKYTLKVHKRTHTEANDSQVQDTTPTTNTVPADNATKEPRFTCIICQYSFVNKDHLNKHMEKEHDVILQYDVPTTEPKKSCHICGHMFSAQANLDSHMESMHGLALI